MIWIKKMKDEAEAHADEDAKKKALVDEKNTAEMMIFTAEKSLKEYGDKVPVENKTLIEEKIKEVKTARDGSDIEAIKKSLEVLTAELSKIGEIMNKANQEANANQNTTSDPNSNENIPEEQNEEIKDAETTESNFGTDNGSAETTESNFGADSGSAETTESTPGGEVKEDNNKK